ncbi:MAG: hypothetical protein ABW169_12915 [Sphingobium sp.]
MKRSFFTLALLAAGLTLSGCYDDGYGYGGGVYSAGYYPYGYGYGSYYDGYGRPGYYRGRTYVPAPAYNPRYGRPGSRRDWNDGRRWDRGNWNANRPDRGAADGAAGNRRGWSRPEAGGNPAAGEGRQGWRGRR